MGNERGGRIVADWNYGDAFKRYPLDNTPYIFDDGNNSTIKVHNIFEPLPSFMFEADCIFVDPPWNVGNLNTFYTKAEIYNRVQNFETFYGRLFECIQEISPKTCYVEIGKEYLDKFIDKLKEIYKYVNFYNSTYYHQKNNKCYVIRGSNKFTKPKLDDMDEEDIIKWICENEDYSCIGDLCMGRGLVGLYAYKNGKKFVGTELNHKRLSVLVERIVKNDIEPKKKTLESATNIIKNTINDIQSCFMQIGNVLKQVKEEKLYLQGGYKNITEYSKVEFNMSKSQTYGYIKVFKLYGNDERLQKYEYSSLILLANNNKSADEVYNGYSSALSKRELLKKLKNEKSPTVRTKSIDFKINEIQTLLKALELLKSQNSDINIEDLIKRLENKIE